MLRELLGEPVDDVKIFGFCWPSQQLSVGGTEVPKVMVELSLDHQENQNLWLKAIQRLEPFCVLQVRRSGPLELEAVFESRYGAQGWLLRANASKRLVTLTEAKRTLKLLYAGEDQPS